MITILKAKEIPIYDTNEEPTGESTVTLTIDVDGTEFYVGGISPKWTKAQIKKYLADNETRIIAELAKTNPIKDRPDLVDLVSRDLCVEIDQIKVSLDYLETIIKK